uniref:CHM Rab escort protein n=1 Tax=Pipistrellus kuhlii TaxID=59472 RepID=A0A7J7V658_PIPKU|nr:CHM Rab escort protein [Pipistrellus kuhlii]
MRENHQSAAFCTPPTGDVPATKVCLNPSLQLPVQEVARGFYMLILCICRHGVKTEGSVQVKTEGYNVGSAEG